mmetsp:Transcript_7147/g.10883  ORF Transcript_7147/g.10883 Transcript_7147/m.10883 type:complete len:314 (-) Transcript_7147:40-981(-)
MALTARRMAVLSWRRVRTFVPRLGVSCKVSVIAKVAKGVCGPLGFFLLWNQKDTKAKKANDTSNNEELASLEIHQCIQKGSLRQLKRVLKSKGSQNYQDEYGRTPIMLAAMYNKTSILRYLLAESDICVNAKDSHGLTALHYCFALRSSQPVKVVNLLMSAGAKPTVEDEYGITAFHKAVAFGQHEIVRQMVRRGVDINIPTGHSGVTLKPSQGDQASLGDTALHIASRKGQDFMTEQLLALGADPSRSNVSYDTPLHDAVRMTHVSVVDKLLENGADPSKVNASDERAWDACSVTNGVNCLRCKMKLLLRQN